MSSRDENVDHSDDHGDDTSPCSSASASASVSTTSALINGLDHDDDDDDDDEIDVDSTHIHKTVIDPKSIDIAIYSASYNLRRASISLLQNASWDVANPRKRPKLSSNESENANFAKLNRELENLSQLIPSSKQQARGRKPASIIWATLHYLDDMKKQIRNLKQTIDQSLIQPNQNYDISLKKHMRITSAHVEVHKSPNQEYMEIIVNCEKRKGLMTELLSSLQTMGLLFDAMNVKYHDGMFNFRALAVPQVQIKPRRLIGEEVVKEAILKVIFT